MPTSRPGRLRLLPRDLDTVLDGGPLRASTGYMPASVTRAGLFLVLSVASSAQTLEIAPTTVERGSAGVFRIVLTADKPIIALQWNLRYRSGLRIEPAGIASGSATERAAKSTNCVLK